MNPASGAISKPERWWRLPRPWVEIFLVANLGFLAVDIGIAHAINAFAHPAEWIPVVFSLIATPLLVLAIVGDGFRSTLVPREGEVGAARPRWSGWLGMLIGWGAVFVGVGGLVFHLRSDFFADATLKNLVYTAPFAAPLAYAGLGLLVILNRMVDARTVEWSRWVLLLAMGGFLGNFGLALADHAQNGFYHPAEWASVIAAAAGVGFLLAAAIFPNDHFVGRLTYLVMGGQVVVGLVGFALHALGNLQRAGSLVDQFLYGSPIFAPLLFADLAILGCLGLWAQQRNVAWESRYDPRHAATPITPHLAAGSS